MAEVRAPIRDVDEAGFEREVIERSSEVPVVVDFWAAWCGPCRMLGPALERAISQRDGEVELAKVDVDANPGLQTRFRVQGIPAVKAFRDGKVVAEFTGAIPPAQIERFLDGVLPSEAEKLTAAAIAAGDEEGLRQALELDPRNRDAAGALARILLGRGEATAAASVLEPLAEGDFALTGLLARARLAEQGDSAAEAFSTWESGDHEAALERLQKEIAAAATAGDDQRRELLRRVMVGCFTELGPASELAAAHRRRLALTLS